MQPSKLREISESVRASLANSGLLILHRQRFVVGAFRRTTRRLRDRFALTLFGQMSFSDRSMSSALVGTVIGCARGVVEGSVKCLLWAANVGGAEPQKLPPLTNPLLMESATSLAAKIRHGQISSEAVVRAYAERISQVNGIINAAVDSRLEEALQEAREADAMVRNEDPEVLARRLPLLGVPFTAKEAVLIQGLSSACGLVSRRGRKASVDSDAVAKLRASGAIPLAITNTSEICMWWETYNKLHGQTNNPYDTSKTVGGSSGGEAALIASAGSLLGLGTDLGGSIRLPALFSGIFGHKPSPGLVPDGGQFPPVLDDVRPFVSTGPMARYACDLRLALTALVGREKAENLHLHQEVDIRSFKVHYVLDDGGHPAQTPVSPCIKEAMLMVVRLLEQNGVSTNKVELQELGSGFFIWCAKLSTIRDQKISRLMVDEEDKDGHPYLELCRWACGRSTHTFPIIINSWAQDYGAYLVKRPLEYYKKKGDELKEKLQNLLEGGGLLLCPTYPVVAPRHGHILATPTNVSYSVVFNALGLPATQCPLGLSPEGLPLGMQIVTVPGWDAHSIALAEYIESKLGGWVCPS